MKPRDIAPISEPSEAELNADTQEMTQTQNVRKIVEYIMNCKLRSYEKERFFKARFPNFASSMPKLFEMVIRDDLNKQHRDYINMMLDMSERLLDKKEIQVIDADKIVYNKLREDYVDPVIGVDKEKIAELMNKKEYTDEELHGGPKFDVQTR